MTPDASAVASVRMPVRTGDKFVVNGAVVTLGEGDIEIQNHEVILLGRDVMLPEDANSPAKRIYYWLMLMYLDAPGQEIYRLHLLDDMNDLLNTTSLLDVTKALGLIHQLVQRNDLGRAMESAKALIAFEADLLAIRPKAAA